MKPRKWGVMALSLFISLLWQREGYRIRDVLHGYKGFTLAAFRKIDPLDHGLSIDLEMAVRSYRLRLRRVEFPIREVARPFGETTFPILPTALRLLRDLNHELRRRD